MARNRPALVVWSEYLALRAVSGFMHCFNVEQNLQTASTVGSLFHRFSRRHRRRAESNIAQSFPEWPPERVGELAES